MCLNVSYLSTFENSDCIVAFISDKKEIVGKTAVDLDSENNSFISRALKHSEINGKFGESIKIVSPTDDIKCVIALCIGDRSLSQKDIEDLGGKIFTCVPSYCRSLFVCCDGISSEECDDIPARLCYGAVLKSWQFDKYKTTKKECKLQDVKAISTNIDTSYKIWKLLKNLISAVFMTRELVSEPANTLTPASFADRIMNELLPLGVKVEVFDETEIRHLGMGALLGVSQGSDNPPKFVVMNWNGGSEDEAPIAFVGKGVTFDSGGLDIKTYPHMEGMKGDMAGAAAVVGLMKVVALNECKKNIVCVAGLVENMPSGKAQKSGDIVTSMSGQTIEVLNTDAEGRLTLADALWYTQDKFKPQYMVDLATLTGAILYCLGDEYAGLFSNSDKLSKMLEIAGEKSGEKLWRLPMNDYYDSTIESSIADLKNITSPGVKAGSITAAHFLKKFVNNIEWAHLDIAGVESISRNLDTVNSGATGFGVRLLYQFLESFDCNDCSDKMKNNAEKLGQSAAKSAQTNSNVSSKKETIAAVQQKQNEKQGANGATQANANANASK